MQGQSIELFFINGRADGMMTAEVFGWTGHLLLFPRTQVKDALKRKEAEYTGMYILLGEVDDEPMIYVGEGENISKRIKEHVSNKNWWTSCIIITSTANNLNKAHAQYLESRLIEEANKVGRAEIENKTSPERPSLTEAGNANMETFLSNTLLVLPALRIDYFLDKVRNNAKDTVTQNDPANLTFEMSVKKKNILANAIVINGEFVVLKGSRATDEWIGKNNWNKGYKKLREQLLKNGTLKLDGQCTVFTSDYVFSSPSAAAAVITGRASNGRTEWKVQGTNQTYAQWEKISIEK